MLDHPITDHPDRQGLMDEIHARPIDILDATCRLRRLVFVMPERAGAVNDALARFAEFCRQAGHPVPTPDQRQHALNVDGRHVTWELHTEFVTLTWRSDLRDDENAPAGLGLQAIGDGLLIGAMRVDVLDDPAIPDRLVSGFSLPSLCLADIENGNGQVATDFLPDSARFTRFELAAGGLTPLRRSIVARRLLEVETYRIMALLGLPLARAAGPELRQIEIALTQLMDQLSESWTGADFQSALATLQQLSVRSGRLSERLDYRFAAGEAYGNILHVRLAGLRETATARGSTLAHYLSNRVDPALATCAAVAKRLATLTAKIERASGLLNVRIGVDSQLQSAAVLDSIARTAHSQFLLQRTVEGLSTIAISYYLLGILSYLFAGPLEHLHWDKTMALSLSAPLVVGMVWLMVRHIRKSHEPRSPR